MGLFDFLFGDNKNSDDFKKGREDGWRDRYIYGDSYHHDMGNRNKSESYQAGYDAGYDEGDDGDGY